MLWRATPVQQFPARDEVHDLAAGSRGFAEGLPPSGRRGPEVPLTDTVSLSPRISVILHAAGPRGPPRGTFSPYACVSPDIPHPTRTRSCERILHATSQGPSWGPRGPSHSFPRGLRTARDAGGSSSRKRGPHPGAEPRRRGRLRALGSSVAPAQ